MEAVSGGLLVLSIAPTARPDSGTHRPQTVLVIYSNDRSLPANRQVDDALRETLAVKSNSDLTYLAEYLDYPRYADEDDEHYDELVSDFLRAKYAGHSIDVVVAGGSPGISIHPTSSGRSISEHAGSRHCCEPGFLRRVSSVPLPCYTDSD